MNPKDMPIHPAELRDAQHPLSPLLQAPISNAAGALGGVVIGELLALTEAGESGEAGSLVLVRHPAQAEPGAIAARSVVDLHGAHIGRSVVLVFENGDPARPIVVGVLQGQATAWPLPETPAQVQVQADGARMIVSAKNQLVLRCGKASITLTHAGKVLIEGSYLLSRSTGVNRIKGGSVQLN